MLTAKYYSNSDIRLENIPVPKISRGEILVKVMASGICGTDVMEWYRIKKAPRVLGHEIAGIIVESRLKKYHRGQRVFVSHHVSCGKCKYCLSGNQTACQTLHEGNYDPGGYSEFVRVPRINAAKGVYLLPEKVSFDEATMIEPLACVIRAQKVIGVKSSDVVLILGSGISGLLNIRVAKLNGAKVVATDIDRYRLNKARQSGADKVVSAAESGGLKADKIIICTGALPALLQAFRCIERKGVILLFAIPAQNIEIPAVDVWRNEITITSSYGASGDDLSESLSAIASGKIEVGPLITHRFPLKDNRKGFRLVSHPKESLKVVLTPFA